MSTLLQAQALERGLPLFSVQAHAENLTQGALRSRHQGTRNCSNSRTAQMGQNTTTSAGSSSSGS